MLDKPNIEIEILYTICNCELCQHERSKPLEVTKFVPWTDTEFWNGKIEKREEIK